MQHINYQHQFLSELAEILLERPDDAIDRLDKLTAINDEWDVQSSDDRQANCNMIEAIYEVVA
jgi:hypothetical protein